MSTVGKLVVLKLDGNLEQHGFRVAVEIGAEGDRPLIELMAALPADPELVRLLHQWQHAYRSLGMVSRIIPQGVFYGGAVNWRDDCQSKATALRDRFNQWLDAPTFRPASDRLRESLDLTESIRLWIRTQDCILGRLPWSLWHLVEQYSQAEITIGQLTTRRVTIVKKAASSSKVNVLVILGAHTGIQVDADRAMLEQLPDVEVSLLVEPSRRQLTQQLWQQSWDILFFAGHSQTEGEQGRIYLSSKESLTLEELKYGLRQAIAQGLQLAIFNSCDGLGLAQELEHLPLPQMIVMREPVPDPVAQEFLQCFLTEFRRGETLHLAVRKAREQLEGLEGEFPCASWLPVICQNSVESPLNWQQLLGAGKPESTVPVSHSHPLPVWSPFYCVLFISGCAASLVMAARFLTWLQPGELWAFDHLMRLQPAQALDPRILVVEVTQEDINDYVYPLEDRTLTALIETLEQYQPRAIGLDMHRFQARGQGRENFIAQFQQNPNLFTVCAFDIADKNYAPPGEFSQRQVREQVGFSDLEIDESLGLGEVVRRQLLSYDPQLSLLPSSCTTPFSFSFQLARRFLQQAGITPITLDNRQQWQFGTAVLTPLTPRFGGYQQLDGQSNQMLIHYRAGQPGQRVTLNQVLTGRVAPSLVRDRIVLIGTTAPVARDEVQTPIGKMPGIWVHAHQVSQILSAVTERRPPIWGTPQWRDFQWGDALWVFVWSWVGAGLTWRVRSWLLLVFVGGVMGFALHSLCWAILLQGGWMPLVPSMLAFLLAGSFVLLYKRFYLGK